MHQVAGTPAPSVNTGFALEKVPSGIEGLDGITAGGLPKGRPTLVVGKAGSGKTLFAMQFLVSGATRYNEPGVFVSFEETAEDLIKNVHSLGFDLPRLLEEEKIAIDYVRIEKSEIEETGEYDLDGLFIRLAYAIDSIGAKRVALDTIEVLFSGLSNEGIIRAELRRLFSWLKEKGVTAVITGESGRGDSLTRHGLEEYVSDAVILLDHRVTNQISTRRLRIVKYRGSTHGTNEYPFLITGNEGLVIMPITALGLEHEAPKERVSTGIERLDAMLGGKGYYRGSSVLVSGTPGTGKTSLAVTFADAICRRGERCLYFAFEESSSQIVRNMRSIGIDLVPLIDAGLLAIHSSRPTAYGLETHLAAMLREVQVFRPDAVVVDPISNLISVSTEVDSKAMLIRFVDYLKINQITGIFTDLTTQGGHLEQTNIGISSLMDTWILLKFIESGGERNRGLYVLKSRGMAHSNQIREVIITDQGIDLADVYLGPGGVLTGSARYVMEMEEEAEIRAREDELRARRIEAEREQRVLEARIAALQAEHQGVQTEFDRFARELERKKEARSEERGHLARMRKADTAAGNTRREEGGKDE
ncbi:circadian clock protein KaiC [Methanoculleus sp. Wushi-C6]|uniref:non-specific serine/threonine protein kinase n=1 Tax=Methanoculleus caldifontis TaxID=2651577 RepID=A0ABU3X3K0_9EURY|nr:circadian clock protein KaiC [Methanoculleus sp. Wushi-C6]MDV2482639.1 circadian clock protein KaiC [Methanoculleus sp. Wushi-C6]